MLEHRPLVEIDPSTGSVAIHGALVQETIGQLLSEVASSCSPDQELAVDLSDVRVIDSAGFTALKAIVRRQRAHCGSVQVVRASDHVVELLGLVGVPHTCTVPTCAP
jgi:ABC-type transporter Mla MlaB component